MIFAQLFFYFNFYFVSFYYRWWPAKVCIPSEIPEKILNLPHVIGQFPVMFFGSKDYSWVHSGRVFKYQDGDKGGNAAGKLSASLANYFKNGKF